jgi:hypothetical protein
VAVAGGGVTTAALPGGAVTAPVSGGAALRAGTALAEGASTGEAPPAQPTRARTTRESARFTPASFARGRCVAKGAPTRELAELRRELGVGQGAEIEGDRRRRLGLTQVHEVDPADDPRVLWHHDPRARREGLHLVRRLGRLREEDPAVGAKLELLVFPRRALPRSIVVLGRSTMGWRAEPRPGTPGSHMPGAAHAVTPHSEGSMGVGPRRHLERSPRHDPCERSSVCTADPKHHDERIVVEPACVKERPR